MTAFDREKSQLNLYFPEAGKRDDTPAEVYLVCNPTCIIVSSHHIQYVHNPIALALPAYCYALDVQKTMNHDAPGTAWLVDRRPLYVHGTI